MSFKDFLIELLFDPESPEKREHAETIKLANALQPVYDASVLGKLGIHPFAERLALMVCEQAKQPWVFNIIVKGAILGLLEAEGARWKVELDPNLPLTTEASFYTRQQIRRTANLIAHLEDWTSCVVDQLVAIVRRFPKATPGALFDVDVVDLIQDQDSLVDEIIHSIGQGLELNLFKDIAERMDANNALNPKRKIDLLHKTPYELLLTVPVDYGPPFEQRFEGTWVLGGPGSGKTQLIQRIIASDIEKYGIVVIDSQDEMIDKIAHLAILKNKEVILIDPRDVEHPISLNLLDLGLERAESYSEEDQRALENSALDMYTSIFGSLFGAELSSKQSVVFTALAKLLMKQPGANLLTFFDLMYDEETLQECLVRADNTTRLFFEQEWPRPDYKETKSQILRRLWAIRMNETFCAMFRHKKNKINLFEAMQRGAVVLIKTSQSFLQPEWSSIFGKFFIILLQQAVVERSTIKDRDKRTPCFIYIDECFEYLKGNDRLSYLLNQMRKYRCGIHLCHQNVGQIPRDMLGSFKSSTAIKFASGVSGEDRSTMAREMDIEADFFKDLKKVDGQYGEWVCWLRGQGAVKVRVPFGVLEQLPRMTNDEYAAMLSLIRHRYGPDRDEPPEIIPDDRVEFLPPEIRHTERKRIAEQKGVHRWGPPEPL